eukprot:COSAG05_NODE_45_length_25418_cov_92.923299_24_plen_176_part_00
MDPGGLACRAGVKLQMKLRDFQGIDVRNQSFEQTMNMIRATPRPWKLSFDMLLPDLYTMPICSRRCVVCRRRGLSIARQFNSCAFLRQPFSSDESFWRPVFWWSALLLTHHPSLITHHSAVKVCWRGFNRYTVRSLEACHASDLERYYLNGYILPLLLKATEEDNTPPVLSVQQM